MIARAAFALVVILLAVLVAVCWVIGQAIGACVSEDA